VRRYAHPSRLFFFSLHLYDKDDASHGAAAAAAPAVVKTTTDRPIDAVTAAPAPDAPTPRSYEFYPGTGVKDDHVSARVLELVRLSALGLTVLYPYNPLHAQVHNIINVPLTPLWAVEPARAPGSTAEPSGPSKAGVVVSPNTPYVQESPSYY
jgi:hypothetical protein